MNDIITIVAIQGECDFLDDILFSDGSVFENKVKSTAKTITKIIIQF